MTFVSLHISYTHRYFVHMWAWVCVCVLVMFSLMLCATTIMYGEYMLIRRIQRRFSSRKFHIAHIATMRQMIAGCIYYRIIRYAWEHVLVPHTLTVDAWPCNSNFNDNKLLNEFFDISDNAVGINFGESFTWNDSCQYGAVFQFNCGFDGVHSKYVSAINAFVF